ncbi:helix-turn-helix domain-containing protein [Arthrobacter glacialis]|uniref:XRE family transcriptional regulator n=1 Tax=Arthrobacter glacialis TaxID=1664 RepID=A0A2S3ZW14_ARTGL|nr:helix-turn-helix transcriptional regulator [Arthrobacter glacialis]POH73451.1 XRE family transcriptional regulator [Arthrobacter glacialis]
MLWNEEDAKRLGSTLRRLREERGLTQESLAFRAGVTKNQLQLIEGAKSSGRKDSVGHSNPRISTLAGLAEVLGLEISEILAEANM